MPLNNTRTYKDASENYAHTNFTSDMRSPIHNRMSIEQKIRFIQQKTGWTQSRLAEELGTTQPTVNRWLKGAEPEGPRRDAINDLYDEIYGATNILEHFVPLKGKVGAGQEIYAVEDDDPTQTAEAPANAKPNTVAVMVSGDSMYPAYEDGAVLFYSRLLPPENMVNRRAVVQLTDGRIFVKIVRPGSTPNVWTLQSINSQYADMVDQEVEWVAPIDWIRPRR